MKPWLIAVLLAAGNVMGMCSDATVNDIDQPPHSYWQRPLKDPFTFLKARLDAGEIELDHSGEKAFLASLLRTLDIPASSQMLVFSTTSLQLRFISPANPRALYFNEEIYVGFIPGGRIEIVSLDPELGGIFYIFDVPKGPGPLQIDRSNRCMNCHAAEDTGHVPGLVIKSVVPGPGGGSLMAFRQDQTGHGIPFDQRFGGWHVTGKHGITNHWGNLMGRLTGDELTRIPLEPGARFDFARYPVPTSDILPHLLLEHQAGFVNRVVEASYRSRTHLERDQGKLTDSHAAELDRHAKVLTRYMLFADEAPLPSGGVEGDGAFKADFLRSRKTNKNGASLKDFDLRTRLFKHRCSYMLYSRVFQGLPAEMRERVYRELAAALGTDQARPDYAYLSAQEKSEIRSILRETLTDLPAAW